MSPDVTALSVAVVSPIVPKFAPPESFTLNGFAAAHTASPALPSSVGAAKPLSVKRIGWWRCVNGRACHERSRGQCDGELGHGVHGNPLDDERRQFHCNRT